MSRAHRVCWSPRVIQTGSKACLSLETGKRTRESAPTLKAPGLTRNTGLKCLPGGLRAHPQVPRKEARVSSYITVQCMLLTCVAASERHTENPAWWGKPPGRKEPARKVRGHIRRLRFPAPSCTTEPAEVPRMCRAVWGSSSWADTASPWAVPFPLPPRWYSPRRLRGSAGPCSPGLDWLR